MIFFIWTTTLMCAIGAVLIVGPSNLRKEGLRVFLLAMFLVFVFCPIYFEMGRMYGEHNTFETIKWLAKHEDELDERMPTFSRAAKAKPIPIEIENIADGSRYMKASK